jgi:hypothetical protein
MEKLKEGGGERGKGEFLGLSLIEKSGQYEKLETGPKPREDLRLVGQNSDDAQPTPAKCRLNGKGTTDSCGEATPSKKIKIGQSPYEGRGESPPLTNIPTMTIGSAAPCSANELRSTPTGVIHTGISPIIAALPQMLT